MNTVDNLTLNRGIGTFLQDWQQLFSLPFLCILYTNAGFSALRKVFACIKAYFSYNIIMKNCEQMEDI